LVVQLEGPDIVVTEGGRRLLAVEVKLGADVDRAVAQLAAYMSRLLYPAGMVVVEHELVILRRDFGVGTVERVGQFSTVGVDGLEPPPSAPGAEATFASRVQRWLESLRDPFVMDQLPEPLRRAVADWIVPEVEAGEVRATGPRPPVARVG
jgi:hypothetical protein